MDATDRTILKALSVNGRLPVKQLAQQAYLSSPAVSARMERLEKKQVIKGYQAMLDHEALGYHIMAFVNFEVSPDRLPGVVEDLMQRPNVLECHHITGAYSLILKVAFCTTKDLEAFVGYLQTYGKTQTQVVFSTLIEPRQIVE